MGLIAALLAHIALFATLTGVASGHAWMTNPPSRNELAFRRNEFFCPHCGQGAGRKPGICGDPFQNTALEPKFKSWRFDKKFYGHTTFKAGQVIKVTVKMSTNHGGRMQVAICPKPASQANQACFEQHLLRRVNTNSKYSNKLYWYLTKKTQSGDTVTESFKLPAGVTCEKGCLLQWGWLGYQTCVQPCKGTKDDVPGECGINLVAPVKNQCQDLGKIETFYNCADIIIKP